MAAVPEWRPFPRAGRALRNHAQKQIEGQVLLRKVEFPTPIRSSVTVVGGVLCVNTGNKLFAIGRR